MRIRLAWWQWLAAFVALLVILAIALLVGIRWSGNSRLDRVNVELRQAGLPTSLGDWIGRQSPADPEGVRATYLALRRLPQQEAPQLQAVLESPGIWRDRTSATGSTSLLATLERERPLTDPVLAIIRSATSSLEKWTMLVGSPQDRAATLMDSMLATPTAPAVRVMHRIIAEAVLAEDRQPWFELALRWATMTKRGVLGSSDGLVAVTIELQLAHAFFCHTAFNGPAPRGMIEWLHEDTDGHQLTALVFERERMVRDPSVLDLLYTRSPLMEPWYWATLPHESARHQELLRGWTAAARAATFAAELPLQHSMVTPRLSQYQASSLGAVQQILLDFDAAIRMRKAAIALTASFPTVQRDVAERWLAPGSNRIRLGLGTPQPGWASIARAPIALQPRWVFEQHQRSASSAAAMRGVSDIPLVITGVR